MNVDRFSRPAPLPMPEYAPLIVTPVQSRKKPGEIIAFLGKQMCFFEKKDRIPEVDKPVEVMITNAIYGRREDGMRDFNRVFALILRVVTSKFTLIEHDGFECFGTMCQTTATMTGPRELLERFYSHGKTYKPTERIIGPWLTPGRSQIYEAGNVNAPYDHPYVPLRPGRAWVSTKKLEDGHFPLVIEGLARVEDGMFAHAVKKDEVKA